MTQRWFEDFAVAFVEQRTRFLAPAFIGDTIHPEHEYLIVYRPAA